MGQVQQRVLTRAAARCAAAMLPLILLGLSGSDLIAKRIYDDDPMWTMPKPVPVPKAKQRKLSEYYDYFYNTFGKPGEHHDKNRVIPAQGVNTLGEVPDSLWYTNRHARKRMTREELMRGPGDQHPPSTKGPWRVLSAKTEGVTPGLTIVDAENRRYLLKFDPKDYPELASSVDVIGSKFFYALGYNTPENYIVYFDAAQLVADPKAKILNRRGVERPMQASDITYALSRVPRDERGRYRALASYYLPGKPVGPFRYDGTRADDPNDIYPHEHRRDLRGLYVFASWLNHTDTKSINSLDVLTDADGVQAIRHYLIDFGAILGSDSFMPKSPRNGNVYMFDWTSSAKEFFTLGLYVPRWSRADYPHIQGAGRLESEVFDADRWRSNYYNPAFANLLPDDAFWAAKQVMAFTDDDIRAIVETGQYTDPAATDWVTRCLIERRNKIGRTWFGKVLPLDQFRVENGRIAFDDLGVKYGFQPARQYTYRWFTYDPRSEASTPISGASSAQAPAAGPSGFLSVEVRGEDSKKFVTVYLRKRGGVLEVAGLDRHW